MVPNRLWNGAQCCFNKFDCRWFTSKFSHFAFYLSLQLSVASKRLDQICCKYCNLSVSLVVNMWFTTNGMCVKNNTHVARTRRNKMSTTWDLYCCLVPQCERSWQGLVTFAENHRSFLCSNQQKSFCCNVRIHASPYVRLLVELHALLLYMVRELQSTLLLMLRSSPLFWCSWCISASQRCMY